MKKIGILTGGADCPGLNSVIRAVVRKAMVEGYVVTGIKNGWMGLVDNNMRVLDLQSTSGILDRGGTILGTSRIVPPMDEDKMQSIKENFDRSGIDAIIAVGGEDTLAIASDLYEKYKMPIVGVPKSIDNALSGTDYAFGFDTAVNIATSCIDRLHTTAESHHRIMIVEVIGRYTGWIALHSGNAGGADIILVPEFPVQLKKVNEILKNRQKRGKTFSIIVISEGAIIEGHQDEQEHLENIKNHRVSRVGELLADLIEDETGFEARVSVLGHIQRGGAPTSFDRIIATRFGFKSIELVLQKKFGYMASLYENKLSEVKIKDAVKKHKAIDKDLYDVAKAFTI